MKNVLILSSTASAINYRNSLINDPGYRLFFTDASPFAPSLYEPAITPLLIPPARQTEKYRSALDQIISKYKIDYLIPTSDHDMEGVALLRKQGWSPPVKFFNFDTDNFFLYTDKLRLTKRVAELGFTSARLFSENEKISFPVVIKPTREGGSKGVWIVHSQPEFEEKLHLIKKQFGNDIIIQEYIPGETGSIFVVLLLYGKDAELYGEAVSQSSLTYMTWGGGGNAGNIVNRPELLDYAKKMLARLGGWKGPINMEFKQHAGNGQYYLMEINCRLNGYSYLTTMNGLNFPRAVLDLLEHGKTEFLSPENIKNKRNFIIDYREKIVSNWIQ